MWGLYEVESPIPGVFSVEVPSNILTRFGRSATGFAKYLTDLVPGLGDIFEWVT